VCRDVRILLLLWQLGVAQRRARGLERDLGACPVSSRRGHHILGPMRTLISLNGSILVSLLLYFKLEHFIIYVSLMSLKNSCNKSLFKPCMCVLYINTLVLASRMDPG
jgi:hypothetical protein